MIKSTQIKEIQKRLPKGITIVDETTFDFTDDEYVGILCWIKYFNHHYERFEMGEFLKIIFPIISIRLRLDFGLYITKSTSDPYRGYHCIYLSENGKQSDGKAKKQSTKAIIQTWKL